MTREKALLLMDRLNEAGYRVKVLAIPPDARFQHINADKDGRVFSVEIVELGVDIVDLKALVSIADELEVDCTTHGLEKGVIRFANLNTTPAAVANTRRHPLGKDA